MPLKRALRVAEIGINHNGDMSLAEEMIRAAAQSGADAVKFQNYRTEDFLPDRSLTHTYIWKKKRVTESQFDIFKRCEVSYQNLAKLKNCCDRVGIDFFSTPTGSDGIKELQKLGVKWLKNGSDYLGHLPLIREMARSGIPTIISTGMAIEAEITEAVNAFREAGGLKLVLLACTSTYPAAPESLNLLRIPSLAKKYGCPAGFSDHSVGWEAAVAAVCAGACIIEKHFTTNRNLPGPDQGFSCDPNEFKILVSKVREAEKMLGNADLNFSPQEISSRQKFKLSCRAARDLPVGTILRAPDIVCQRPAIGIAPGKMDSLLGRELLTSLRKGEPILWNCVSKI